MFVVHTRYFLSTILTLRERPLCISQSDWNYHSARFWHFRKIPGEELPPESSDIDQSYQCYQTKKQQAVLWMM